VRNSEPFSDLLESAADTRRMNQDARRAPSKRQEPGAPQSHESARRDALARDEVVRPKAAKSDGTTDAPQSAEDSQTNAKIADGETSTGAADGESEQTVETAAKAEAGETKNVASPLTETSAKASGDEVASSETAAKDDQTDKTDSASPTAAEPMPQPEVANSDESVEVAEAAPVDDEREAAPEPEQTEASAAPETVPEDQVASPVTDPTKAAATATATAASAAHDSDAEVSASTTTQPVQPRGAASLPEQAQPQQAAQAANTAIAAKGDASAPFEGDADSQPQKQSEALASHSKPQEAKSTPHAEIAKPAIPPVDPASAKGQPISLPEPARALGASFNAASLQAANMNDRNPVALNASAIAVEIVSRMRDGMRRFDIRLDPPELGRIDVRLDVDRHGNVTTKLTVDKPETLDLMQRDARGLERALQQAGLKTDSGGLEFSLRSHADQNPAHDQSGRGLRSPDAQPGDESARIEVVIEGYRAAAFARGGVDIRI
jgi:chemotaxis protein MotD